MRFLLLFSSTLLWAFSLISQDALALEIDAKQAILKDAETGQILFQKNQTEQMPTSSMSKVMTMYMVFDALEQGKITLDTEFKVSEKAWKKGGSKMFVEVDKNVKVEDLIRGVIIQSGNDATIVLAEGLAGSENSFARQMTEKAKELGMKNSNFTNASGWPDANHYSTAEDLAILGSRMIEDFPQYYKYYAETEFEFNSIKQPNRNPLLYRNIGADGIKTGHTEVGGYGLIGTAKQNNRRVIMVINGLESGKARADTGSRLIEWGLNNFENKTLFSKGNEVAGAKVIMGEKELVPMKLNDDIHLTLPKSDQDQIKFSVHYQSPLQAPVSQGEEIGTLKIIIPEREPLKVPLFAANDVEPVGFFKRILINAKLFLKSVI
ncbi:MAG: D-alanyl-D-alanine carboxypeptidase family protein [Pseudomonadota bacterium]